MLDRLLIGFHLGYFGGLWDLNCSMILLISLGNLSYVNLYASEENYTDDRLEKKLLVHHVPLGYTSLSHLWACKSCNSRRRMAN
jgi:hypothetical protein